MTIGGTSRIAKRRPRPIEPRSMARCGAHSAGQANGAFQPPKKRVTIRPETTKTLTYSAKKKKPKRIPEYSVAKPATISLSASVRSNGVRFASAVAAMKKIRAPSGCWKTYQFQNQPDWFRVIWLRLI